MATVANYQYAYSLTGSGTYTIGVEAGETAPDAYSITDDNFADGTAPVGVQGADTISVTDTNGTSTISTSTTLATNTTIVGYTGSDVVVSDGTNSYLLTNTLHATPGADSFTPAVTTGVYTYCFLAGTQISTLNGSVAVENLNVGDEVLTADGNVAKVRFNFSQVKSANIFAGKKHFPVKISAGALADNVPSADLYVTPDHAMYFPELNIFAEASTLINGMSIYQMIEMPENFTYYHILCDNQEIVLANNTPAETFIDNATMREFDNYDDYAAMYPESHEMIELDIARAKASRQLPRALKQQLADRAEQLFPSTLRQAA